MADDKIQFTLDLDAKEFQAGIESAIGVLGRLGEGGQLNGLIEGLGSIAKVAGVVGVAFLALKSTFETVFEAEKIKQINEQFEIFTTQAGIATETLKTGLMEASKGLVDDTDLLITANKALIEFGKGAERLPELMDIATKSTQVFGGTAKERFEQITQAVTTGNMRQLKYIGITIDSDKALRKYAETLGITKDQLSDAERKQALMNAVIEKGNKNFKDVTVDLNKARTTWEQLKVTMSNISEVFTLAFEKIAGGATRNVLRSFSDFATIVKDRITAVFGSGREMMDAEAKNTERHLTSLRAQLYDLQKEGVPWYQKMFGTDAQEEIKKVRKEIELNESWLKRIEDDAAKKDAAQKEKATVTTGGDEGQSSQDKADYDKRKQHATEFETDMLRMQESRIRSAMSTATTITGVEIAYQNAVLQERKQLEAELSKIDSSDTLTHSEKLRKKEEMTLNYHAKIAEMDRAELARKDGILQQEMSNTDSHARAHEIVAQRKNIADQQYQMQKDQIAMMDDITSQQRDAMKQQAKAQHEQQITMIHDEYTRQREAIDDRWAQHGNGAADQWARGFAGASKQASYQLTNFAAQGAQVFNIMGNSMSNAFMKMGEGSKKGSAVMREAMLGMIADIAQYYGQMLLLSSVFPPNPLGLAAGAGLLVLAGYLRSKSKGSAGEMGGGAGGGMGEYGSATGLQQNSQNAMQSQKQSRSVSVNIAGNYFDTDSTRQRLTELVRESLDSTDFSVRKIGQV